jgi:hypothetical protein
MAGRRDDIAKLRLPGDLKSAWQAAASASGLTLSEWLREAATEHVRREAGAPGLTQLREELVGLRREISAIGRNLNQLTRHANATGEVAAARLDQLLADLDALRRQASLALREVSP